MSTYNVYHYFSEYLKKEFESWEWISKKILGNFLGYFEIIYNFPNKPEPSSKI